MSEFNTGFYTLPQTTLCFRLLKVIDVSENYVKIKVDWWNKTSKEYWGNSHGLPRYWKTTKENLARFKVTLAIGDDCDI